MLDFYQHLFWKMQDLTQKFPRKLLNCAVAKQRQTKQQQQVNSLFDEMASGTVLEYIVHSSEIRGLCLMKCPSETLQNGKSIFGFSYTYQILIFVIAEYVTLS